MNVAKRVMQGGTPSRGAPSRGKPSRTKPSGAKRTARILYGVLVALSAIIVVAFAALKLFAQAPEQAAPPTAPPVTSSAPTDNPDTSEDESRPKPTPVPLVRQEKVYTFLLAAGDAGGGNADTIMVVKYDIPNQTVGVVSILRDTMTEDYAKINASYGKGVENLKETVSDLLGIPIDFYITVNMKGFKALVDAVGGIDFYVPTNMNYDDTTPGQEFHIHYSKGTHHLNGQQALEVARFRHNNDNSGYNDTGRTETQRNLLAAVAKKVLSPSGILKIDKYIEIFQKYVKTDLSASDILHFIDNARNVDLESGVNMSSLPGESFGDKAHRYKGATWCIQLFPEESLQIVNSLINPYTTEMTMDDVNFIQAW